MILENYINNNSDQLFWNRKLRVSRLRLNQLRDQDEAQSLLSLLSETEPFSYLEEFSKNCLRDKVVQFRFLNLDYGVNNITLAINIHIVSECIPLTNTDQLLYKDFFFPVCKQGSIEIC